MLRCLLSDDDVGPDRKADGFDEDRGSEREGASEGVVEKRRNAMEDVSGVNGASAEQFYGLVRSLATRQ